MSRALCAVRHRFSSHDRLPVSMAWPTPAQLAGLGTVLCLYHADGSELAGWRQAVSVHACQGLDSEGVNESLCFTDARGRCVWRLYLLPDSDFLAWDRLVAQLPARPQPPPRAEEGNVGERLWRRLAGHLGGQRWRVCALRLHPVEQGTGLAASLSTLSALGSSAARRIARLEGADGESGLDACCCASAAHRHGLLEQTAVMPLVRV